MKKKEFDAVKMMREIRDKMSKQYSKMTIEGGIRRLTEEVLSHSVEEASKATYNISYSLREVYLRPK